MEHSEVHRSELSTDLKASVAARRELGPELEDQVIEAFLARVQTQVDARLAQQDGRAKPVERPPQTPHHKYNPTEIVATSFGVAIPLTVFAGIFGGHIGVIMVMAAVIAVNLMYVVANRR